MQPKRTTSSKQWWKILRQGKGGVPEEKKKGRKLCDELQAEYNLRDALWGQRGYIGGGKEVLLSTSSMKGGSSGRKRKPGDGWCAPR